MGTFADVQRGLAVVLLSHPLDVGTIAWWAARARRSVWALLLLALAAAMILGLQLMGLGPHKLSAFAPDLALTLAAVGLCFCLPAALRAARRGIFRNPQITLARGHRSRSSGIPRCVSFMAISTASGGRKRQELLRRTRQAGIPPRVRRAAPRWVRPAPHAVTDP